MAFEHYIHAEGKRLRCGYTTGTCAALAAAGAAQLLLTGTVPPSVSLTTPKGLRVETELLHPARGINWASAAVCKDAGDDCDVTDGLAVYARVEPRTDGQIVIRGGEGVGTVTKPGLDQPIGAAAINSVPRQMITEAVRRVGSVHGSAGGFTVTISVPGGAELARRTFNPRLGIVGGVSILGTSGIVEPMSRQALVDTIALELRQAGSAGEGRVILTPGNYGADYIASRGWDALGVRVVRCSNYIGAAIDEAVLQGFTEILLVGHAGKLVKLAGGIFDTHSRTADCRMELFCAYTALSGGSPALCRDIMDCITCDACHDLLTQAGLWEDVIQGILSAMDRALSRRAAEARIGAVVFSNQSGLWGITEPGRALLDRWQDGKR